MKSVISWLARDILILTLCLVLKMEEMHLYKACQLRKGKNVVCARQREQGIYS